MKHLLYSFIFFFTAFSFAQNTGVVVGKIWDNEVENAPLVFANITVKETAKNVNTDISGFFTIENLEAGNYTLVCSFAGYETQEIKVRVEALLPTEIKVSLAASTVSLGDLALLTSLVEKDVKQVSVLN